MSWFKKHWRKIALLVAGAVGALAGERTIAHKVTPVAVEIIQSVPCTPGEADCPPSDGK